MKAGVPREMAYVVPHFSPGSTHVCPSEEAKSLRNVGDAQPDQQEQTNLTSSPVYGQITVFKLEFFN